MFHGILGGVKSPRAAAPPAHPPDYTLFDAPHAQQQQQQQQRRNEQQQQRKQQQQRQEHRPASNGNPPRLAPWLLTGHYDAAGGAVVAATQLPQATPPPQPLERGAPPRHSPWAASGLPSPVGALLASLDWEAESESDAAELFLSRQLRAHGSGQEGQGAAAAVVGGPANMRLRSMAVPVPLPSPSSAPAAAGSAADGAVPRHAALAALGPSRLPAPMGFFPSSASSPRASWLSEELMLPRPGPSQQHQQQQLRQHDHQGRQQSQHRHQNDKGRDRSPELRQSSPEPWAYPVLHAERSPRPQQGGRGVAGSIGNGATAAVWAALTGGGAGTSTGAESSPRLMSPSSLAALLPPTTAAAVAPATPGLGPGSSQPIPAEWLEGVEELLLLLSPRPVGSAGPEPGTATGPRSGPMAGAGNGVRRQEPWVAQQQRNQQHQQQHKNTAAQHHSHQYQQQQLDQYQQDQQQQEDCHLNLARGPTQNPRRSPQPSVQLGRQQQRQQQQQHGELRGRVQARGRGQHPDERIPRADSASRTQQLQQRVQRGAAAAAAAQSAAQQLLRQSALATSPSPSPRHAAADSAATAALPWTPPGIGPPSSLPKGAQGQLAARRKQPQPRPQRHAQQGQAGHPPQDSSCGEALETLRLQQQQWQRPSGAVSRHGGSTQHSSFDAVASAIAGSLLLQAEQMGLAPGDGAGGGDGGPAAMLLVEPGREIPAPLRGAAGGGAVAAVAAAAAAAFPPPLPFRRGASGGSDCGTVASLAALVADCGNPHVPGASPRLEAVEEFLGYCQGGGGGGGGAGHGRGRARSSSDNGTPPRAAAGAFRTPSVTTAASRWAAAGGTEPLGQVGQPRMAWGPPQQVQQQQQQRLLPRQQAPLPAAMRLLAKRVFEGWRRQVALRRMGFRLAQWCGQRLRFRALRAWRDHTRAQQARREASWVTLAGLRLLRLLRAAWIAWRRAHAAGLHAARVAAAHRAHSLASRTMRGWVTRWAQRASVRVLLRHRATAMARACLAAWRNVAAHARMAAEATAAAAAGAAALEAEAAAAEEEAEEERAWREGTGRGSGCPAEGMEQRRMAGPEVMEGQRRWQQEEEEEAEEARRMEVGRSVHRVLRLRNCFRCWLLMTDAAVQVMTQQQALRQTLHEELLQDAALLAAADEIARHRYLAPTLHAWRALAAAASNPPTPPAAAAAAGEPTPRPVAAAAAPVAQLQQQPLPPLVMAAGPRVKGPPPALPRPAGGVVPWVMAGAADADRDPVPGLVPKTHGPPVAATAGAVAGVGPQQEWQQRGASSRDSSGSSSCQSFEFKWPVQQQQQHQKEMQQLPLRPQQLQQPPPQQQPPQQTLQRQTVSGGGPLRGAEMMTPQGARLRAPGIDARPGPPRPDVASAVPAVAAAAPVGRAASAPIPPLPPPEGAQAPPQVDAPGPDLRRHASVPSPASAPLDGRRTAMTSQAKDGTGTGTCTGAGAGTAALATPPPETAADPITSTGTGPGATRRLSGTGGAAGLITNTPPSVHATRFVQSRSGGLDRAIGGSGGGVGGSGGAALAELAPDVLFELLESDLAWYTEQYLTPPPSGSGGPAGCRSGGAAAAASATTTTPITKSGMRPAVVAATTTATGAVAATTATTAPSPPRGAAQAVGPAHLEWSVRARARAWEAGSSPLEAPTATSSVAPNAHTGAGTDADWGPASGASTRGGGNGGGGDGQSWRTARGDHVAVGARPGANWPTDASQEQGEPPSARSGRPSEGSGSGRGCTAQADVLLRRQQQQQQQQSSGIAAPPELQQHAQEEGMAAVSGLLPRGDGKAGRRPAGGRRSKSSGSAVGQGGNSGGGAVAFNAGSQWPPMGAYAASPTASDDDVPYKRYVALPGDSRLLRLRGDTWQPAEQW
ncbi:hypothetical protein PLESTB_000560200 [Pleodorina starrii]|uniref:Uncharacterized protein n=1 Tax=Pleodorina starrii TaxID=330485 RepID=A0A9W6BHI0_9CHLO|nr:hypothetical protein PLESTB_000560200 [Pleodorina starrii]